MAHESNWVDSLPQVLLGIRAALKPDLGASSAELVFGTTVRLPGEFLSSTDRTSPHDVLHRLREVMRKLRPTPASRHGSPSVFVHKNLSTSTHVFVRRDCVAKPLTPPYDGPFPVLQRQEKYYLVEINGRPSTISIDRLKPAYVLSEDKDVEVPQVPPAPQELSVKNSPVITRAGRTVKKVFVLTHRDSGYSSNGEPHLHMSALD